MIGARLVPVIHQSLLTSTEHNASTRHVAAQFRSISEATFGLFKVAQSRGRRQGVRDVNGIE